MGNVVQQRTLELGSVDSLAFASMYVSFTLNIVQGFLASGCP
jgi:hypothetical protein